MKNKIDTSLPPPITVVVLTLNEEINIRQALGNVVGWAREVIVLDSGSKDKTCEIAQELGAKVFYRQFDNYANQRNYAIRELPVENEWMFFLDADEYLTNELKDELTDIVANDGYGKNGYYVKRKFVFMGKWIKHGGYYPTWVLRLFKKDKAVVNRDMNEHISIDGEFGRLKHDFIHMDKKDFSFWLEKHNKYSTYEALELLKKNKSKEEKSFAKLTGTQAQRKRWLREKIWNKFLPPLLRPFIYFIYRYILRLGFLDGKTGFIFHFMHGLVYPMIIDIKYLEKILRND